MNKKLFYAYYENQYEDPIYESIKDNTEYKQIQSDFITKEEAYASRIGGMTSELYEAYDELKCTLYRMYNVICRELYVMGMNDGIELTKDDE